MGTGLENARLVLAITNKALKAIQEDEQINKMLTIDARNLKVLTEASRHSVEVIRRIRGLDEPDTTPNDVLTEDDRAVLEQFRDSSQS